MINISNQTAASSRSDEKRADEQRDAQESRHTQKRSLFLSMLRHDATKPAEFKAAAPPATLAKCSPGDKPQTVQVPAELGDVETPLPALAAKQPSVVAKPVRTQSAVAQPPTTAMDSPVAADAAMDALAGGLVETPLPNAGIRAGASPTMARPEETIDAAQRGIAAGAEQSVVEAKSGASANRDDAETDEEAEQRSSSRDSSEPAPVYAFRPFTALVPTQPAPAPPASVGLTPALLQQLVEYAAIRRGDGGAFEFHLGLASGVLDGIRVCVSAFGSRRIGLRIAGSRGRKSNDLDGAMAELVETLSARGLEVVELVVD